MIINDILLFQIQHSNSNSNLYTALIYTWLLIIVQEGTLKISITLVQSIGQIITVNK